MVKASYKAEEDIEDYEREKGTAVFTPYPSINDAVGSLQGGDMIVLGATPGSGKTAMLLNMAVGMAKEGKKIDVFSLEMPMKQLRRRMICSLAEIDSSKFRKFELSEEEKNRYNQYATTEFDKLPIKIFKQQSVTVDYIRTIEMKSDSDIVFIDYLGLIDSYGNKASYEKFSEISRNIKLLAMQSNKPIVCLHQLNREIQNRDDKLPKISDLRDSGKIEQDADMIWFVHRPFCYDANKSPDEMLFMVAKNRHGMNNATIPMVFNGMHQKITEPMKV
jgi:replicative DNA helicase